ncbi:MAG: GntR family transcriptional regulator [Ottowia sp.]|uniref:GntR family transcriptional regulator n=1 Tax=Ottowia sp. TaxID=1898956 RepID=UPI0039E25CCF
MLEHTHAIAAARASHADPSARAGARGAPPPDPFGALRLDTGADAPLWRQLYEQLDELLSSGRVREGVSLPPERELAETLGVSRSTVKRCYDQLRHDQRLAGRGRAGSVVRTPPRRAHATTGHLRDFADELRERGKAATSMLLRLEVVRDARIASTFRRPPSAQFLHVARLRCGDGVPMLRELAWYDLALAPQMVGWDGHGSAHERLARLCALEVGSAEQTMEAVLSSQLDAAAFGLARPQPCLLVKRLTRAANGVPVEYVESTFRGDAYVCRLELWP